ncbi:MAG: outer membrane beta-barrel protein [Pseudomonadota bacterium]
MKLAASVIALLPICAHSAFAQSDAIRNIGVFVSVQESYEDNVLRQPDAFPSPPGFSRDDFRLSPSLNVDIIQPVGRQKLTLLGGVGYDFYRRNSRLERERINLAAKANLAVGADCKPDIGLAFSRQQSDLADFFSVTDFRLRNREQRLTFSSGLKCGGIIGLKPGVTFERSIVKNSSFFRKIGNFNSTAVGVSVGYVNPTLGELSLFGNYRRGNYPNRGAFTGRPNVNERVGVYTGGVRLQREIGERLKGNISLGYTVAEPSVAGTRRFSGISGSADLTAQLSDPLQVVIGFSRSVQQSNQLDVSFTVNDSYNINASYILNPRVVLTAGAARNRRKLRDSPLLQPNLLGSNDRTTQLFGGIRFSPAGPISFSLNGTKSTRRSQARFFDYDASTVSLGVNFNI